MAKEQTIFPAITLYQPWATWIMRGWKTIETRTHNRFRCLKGQTVLIHAGKTFDSSEASIKNIFLSYQQLHGTRKENFEYGKILGSAKVVDFASLSKHDSGAALIDCEDTLRFGLFLSEVCYLPEPIPINGEMGIWYYDIETKMKMRKSPPKKQIISNLFNPTQP